VAIAGLQEHGGVRGELRFPPWEVDWENKFPQFFAALLQNYLINNLGGSALPPLPPHATFRGFGSGLGSGLGK